jgi:uncharacterized protein (TIGR02594 family)
LQRESGERLLGGVALSSGVTAMTQAQTSTPTAPEDDAPWMNFAKEELGKHVKEVQAENTGFIRQVRQQVLLERVLDALENQIASLGAVGSNLDTPGIYKPPVKGKPPKVLRNPAAGVDQWEAESLKAANPEIDKYFRGVMTIPDHKGRQWELQSTSAASDGRGSVTSWCAAFVNWCLSRSGINAPGFGTAKAWLDFGTALNWPRYGAVAVTKKLSNTGSSTGHVGFYVRSTKDKVVLLSGNFSDRVGEDEYRPDVIIGYRWPKSLGRKDLENLHSHTPTAPFQRAPAP